MSHAVPMTILPEQLERFARELGLTQAILVGWAPDGTTHVVTWGDSLTDSAQAAQGGNAVKPELGIAFGNRDHTTILSACERARERLALEPAMRDHLRSVETLLVASTAAASLGTAMPVDRATQMSKGAEEPSGHIPVSASAPEGWTYEWLGQEPASAPPAALGGAHLAPPVDWVELVQLEAAQQRERWGTDAGAGKSSADWFWLLGRLQAEAARVLAAAVAGNTEKALHHTISAGAVLANWHRALSGADARMRPGIVEPT